MLLDLNFLYRNAAKITVPHPHNENLHSIPTIPAAPDSDLARPPLTVIQDAIPRLKPDNSPPKLPAAIPGLSALFRTPDKPAGWSRFGWLPSPSINSEASDNTSSQLPPRSGIITPHLYRGKASSTSSLYSDCSSMQSTPTKSVTKPYSRSPLGLSPRTSLPKCHISS